MLGALARHVAVVAAVVVATTTAAPAPAPVPSDATPTPPEVRVTWTNCKCKDKWEMDGMKCEEDGEACCNPDEDPEGEWCMVEDEDCEDADWGYCRPLSMSTPGCTDYPPSWSDKEGDGCYTYSFYKFCMIDGSAGDGWDKEWGTLASYTNQGYDAPGACCACGGGSYSHQGYNGLKCADKRGWKDKDGDGCGSYSGNFWCTASGQPGNGWHEEWGTFEKFRNDGATATEACCACGGGGEGKNTYMNWNQNEDNEWPSTSWDPWFGGWWVTPQPDADTAGVIAPFFGPWQVASGACKIDSDKCVTSPHYPAAYQADEKCVISVNPDKLESISSVDFRTEWGYDVLKINAISYSGSQGPQGVKPCGAIVWTSDYEIHAAGWKLCPDNAIKAPPPKPVSSKALPGAVVALVLLCGGGVAAYCCCCRKKKDTGIGDTPSTGPRGKYGKQQDEV